jgi:hypothetical protein
MSSTQSSMLMIVVCWWLCWWHCVSTTVLMTLCVDDCVDVLMTVLRCQLCWCDDCVVVTSWCVDGINIYAGVLMCWCVDDSDLCWCVDDCIDTFTRWIVLMCWCANCCCVGDCLDVCWYVSVRMRGCADVLVCCQEVLCAPWTVFLLFCSRYCWILDVEPNQWKQVYLFLFGSELRVYESSQVDFIPLSDQQPLSSLLIFVVR